jgi:hypothetical protein
MLINGTCVFGAGKGIEQEPSSTVQIKLNDITVLMGDRAKIYGGIKYNAVSGPNSFKRFWMENWKNPNDSFEWTVEAPKKGQYKADILISGAPGVKVEISGPNNKIICALQENGWDKLAVPGELELPKGTSIITLRAIEAANLKLKSIELINSADKSKIENRIKEFRSDTKWMADAGYGLMFQWGEWGYPQHGPKKSWPEMINDFNIEKFADMCAETGADYVIWSATWTSYYFPAPIKAIDNILPGRTCSRDLIGELADALIKRGMRLILYYNVGWSPNPNSDWWDKNWISDEDKTKFFNNFCAIATEVSNRYGKKLAGWLIDTGMLIYPAPFEQMGIALKAGNSDRLISYNPWVMPRFTEFQDFFFGEGNERSNYGKGPKGGDGIIVSGPQKGLQGFACFVLDGPDWGIRKPETKINPPQFTRDQITTLVNNALERKLALSFNLLMYEDGSVSPESLDMMKYVRTIVRRK